MSYLLRVLLPDRPGMLGAVATALGAAGADILSVDVVERSAGVAVDDLIVELPPGKLADALVTAAVSVPGVAVESIQRYYAGAGEAHAELELLEALATAPDRAAELLVAGAPRIFRAGWAVVVRYDERGPLVEASSPAAPELVGRGPAVAAAGARAGAGPGRALGAGGVGRPRHRARRGTARRPGPGRAGRPAGRAGVAAVRAAAARAPGRDRRHRRPAGRAAPGQPAQPPLTQHRSRPARSPPDGDLRPG